jgi:hypothetical protein
MLSLYRNRNEITEDSYPNMIHVANLQLPSIIVDYSGNVVATKIEKFSEKHVIMNEYYSVTVIENMMFENIKMRVVKIVKKILDNGIHVKEPLMNIDFSQSHRLTYYDMAGRSFEIIQIVPTFVFTDNTYNLEFFHDLKEIAKSYNYDLSIQHHSYILTLTSLNNRK